jgi:hypothetical protein
LNEAADTLARVESILERGGDPDDALRDVLEALRRVYSYAAIDFVEEGELAAGPSAGEPREPLHSLEVVYGGVRVAELRVAPPPASADGEALLRRIADLVSPHCLVGWDTGGLPWGS